jgi:hypothetical protein
VNDTRTPLEIADEAERILKSEVFQNALQRMADAALEDLLAANGEDADIVRREKADIMKVIRTIPHAIRVEMLNAQQAMKPRGGVA